MWEIQVLSIWYDWEVDIVLADEIGQLKQECAELRQRVHDVELQMKM